MPVRLRFHTEMSFKTFLEEAQSVLGEVPGEVRTSEYSVALPDRVFAQYERDLRELVRDYGGQVLQTK